MSLEQIPAAPVKPKISILPRALMVALSLAVSACHKNSPTHPADKHVDTPLTKKQQLIKKLITETLAVTKGGDNTIEFSTDEGLLGSIQIDTLTVTPHGTYVMLTKPYDGGRLLTMITDNDNNGLINHVWVSSVVIVRKIFKDLKR